MYKIYIYILGFVLNLTLNSCDEKFSVESDCILYLSSNMVKSECNYTKDKCLDIYYKTDSIIYLKPVVIFIHGGGWCAGTKSEWTKEHALTLLENNILSVSVDYELSRYPSQMNDISNAVRWVVDNIEKFGGDKNKIFLFGYSAGAHLSSLLSTDESYLKKNHLNFSYIKGCCAYDGGNYMRQIEYLLGDEIKYTFRNTFGEDVNSYIKVLPYYQIERNENVPEFLIITELESENRRESNKAFAQRLNDYGHKAEILYVQNCDHLSIFKEKFFDEIVKMEIINWINKKNI